MFDHVTIGAADRAASQSFYDLVLGTLGVAATYDGEDFVEWDQFSVAAGDGGRPVTTGLHIGFVAPSREHVDAFWRAGTAAGHPSDGEPGPRPQYGESYYGSFLLDPDGNSVEAVHRDGMGERSVVDHLWLRVADVAASKAFYETIAPFTGFGLAVEEPELARFRGPGASFTVVAGEPTSPFHLAFPVADNQTVDDFHRAATAADHRDNGAPGERAVYHPGYYGAFLLDPDGHNVEAVSHNR
jgi:catechol 2,3-dioxygenase-like lactoylglutathione lyase family enzyme